ncbi:hypothetical protein [Diaphorobacter caeni]|uniref:hypothetical protein n=1 Tax=Diaphorobacter caeni TaxID=2784387 RepID=UPI001E51AA8D|nr:hypothetical protein [Diaphorobacter caeni]
MALAFWWMASIQAVLAVTAFVAVAGIAAGSTESKRRARLLQLAAERQGESICQFARSFDTRVVDTWIIRAVHDTLLQELEARRAAFPVRASDRLDDMFFDADDLDMAVAPEVARRAGRSLDNGAANPYFGKVQTVGDLVMFFHFQAKECSTPGGLASRCRPRP